MENNNEEIYYELSLIEREPYKTIISLYENKELTCEEYHSLNHNNSNSPQSYTALVKTKKLVPKERDAFCPIKQVAYNAYKFETIEYKPDNNLKKDNFGYDKERKIINYGYTKIYCIKRNGEYYDIVADVEIPKEIISQKNTRELHLPYQFEEMMKDLLLIKEHKEIYTKIVCDIYLRLKLDVINYEKAKKEFDKRYAAYKELQEKQTYYIDIENKTNTEITNSNKEKIKQLIYDIQHKNE